MSAAPGSKVKGKESEDPNARRRRKEGRKVERGQGKMRGGGEGEPWTRSKQRGIPSGRMSCCVVTGVARTLLMREGGKDGIKQERGGKGGTKRGKQKFR